MTFIFFCCEKSIISSSHKLVFPCHTVIFKVRYCSPCEVVFADQLEYPQIEADNTYRFLSSLVNEPGVVAIENGAEVL